MLSIAAMVALCSTVMGWLIERHGFANAFGAAAALSALALPYFLMVDRWYGAGD